MRFRLLFLTTAALVIVYTLLCVTRLFPGHKPISTAICLALFFFILRIQLFRRSLKTAPPAAFVWVSAVGLGIWSSFVIFCILIDGMNLLLLIARLAGVEGMESWDLEIWSGRAIRWSAMAALLAGFIGLLQAMRGPVVRRVRVAVASLPAELDGLTIAQISDLHIGAIIHATYIENVVRTVMALAPDIIAFTGDLADGRPGDLQPHTQPLAALNAPLGIYYITGNHEYYSGAPGWIAEAKRLGFTVLLNENRVLHHLGKAIMVAGVTDLGAHHFIPEHKSDPHRAAVSDTPCSLKILLAHQPESATAAEAAGFHLQLSGHTHGGQYFPFSLLVRLFKRYAKGLHRYKNLWIYVNSGTGFWGPPNRFCVPSEITLLELKIDDH